MTLSVRDPNLIKVTVSLIEESMNRGNNFINETMQEEIVSEDQQTKLQCMPYFLLLMLVYNLTCDLDWLTCMKNSVSIKTTQI